MGQLTEIRWHGRGGQGAKTAALLVGEAALGEGKYIQAFPEYGPERTGAPVQSYNRISDEPITLHCHVEAPQVVVILDPTLIGPVDVTEGLPEDGVIIVNTDKSAAEMRAAMGLKGRKLFTVDASRISMETVGGNFPNTPMLGALIKATGILDFNKTILDIQGRMEHKFRNKPGMAEKNVNAVKRAYDEVKPE